MNPENRFAANVSNIIPSLATAADAERLDLTKLSVAMLAADEKRPGVDRHSIIVSDTEKAVEWRVNSLSELFRGVSQPPPDINRYPPGYVPLFAFVEQHIVTFCDEYGDKSDQEFEEVYSNLRRRPDGRSLGQLHDFAWQVCAVMLGTRVVSRAEFEGVIGALATSASKWATGQVSRNYMAYLRAHMPAY